MGAVALANVQVLVCGCPDGACAQLPASANIRIPVVVEVRVDPRREGAPLAAALLHQLSGPGRRADEVLAGWWISWTAVSLPPRAVFTVMGRTRPAWAQRSVTQRELEDLFHELGERMPTLLQRALVQLRGGRFGSDGGGPATRGVLRLLEIVVPNAGAATDDD